MLFGRTSSTPKQTLNQRRKGPVSALALLLSRVWSFPFLLLVYCSVPVPQPLHDMPNINVFHVSLLCLIMCRTDIGNPFAVTCSGRLVT